MSLTYGDIIGSVAVILSMLALYFSMQEYTYKLDPDYDVRTDLVGTLTGRETPTKGKELALKLDKINVFIKNINNLKNFYVVYPDSTIEKLPIKEKQELKTDKIKNFSLEKNGYVYQYVFLVIESLDDSRDLSLIYSKTKDNEFIYNSKTSIELYEWEYGHKDDPTFEGERLIVQEYKQVAERMNIIVHKKN